MTLILVRHLYSVPWINSYESIVSTLLKMKKKKKAKDTLHVEQKLKTITCKEKKKSFVDKEAKELRRNKNTLRT